MSKRLILVIVGALLVLSACAPQASDSTAASAAQTVSMSPLGTMSSGAASTVTGTAELSDAGNGKTKIIMNLSGLEPDGASMGHIHVGDCTVVGPVALGLTFVQADSSGNGSSVSEITTAALPESAYIAFHQRGPTDPEGVGSFVSCGEIK